MEVHAHTHTPRKKWTHYFWEFLMLFLAVTLGFLVENQREHWIEQRREKQFIRSFIEDLKKDTLSLRPYLRRREGVLNRVDSLVILLESGKYKEMGSETYEYARRNARPIFINTDGTMQQLKNSGSLRLIRKQYVVDSIMSYDSDVKFLQNQNEKDYDQQKTFKDLAGEIFDVKVFSRIIDDNFSSTKPAGNPQLITNDPVLINKLAVLAHYHSHQLLTDLKLGRNLKLKAVRLIIFLKKEYHLK